MNRFRLPRVKLQHLLHPLLLPSTPAHHLRFPSKCTRLLCSKVSLNTSWGRMATRLKQDAVGLGSSGGRAEGVKSEKYMDHVKEQSALSPEESLLKLQEQVQEEMASALSRTGAKLEDAYSKMLSSRTAYEVALEAHTLERDPSVEDEPVSVVELRAMAAEFNDLRKKAEYARWQLLIHRQALGFVHRNHIIVQEAYPLPKPIKDEDIP